MLRMKFRICSPNIPAKRPFEPFGRGNGFQTLFCVSAKSMLHLKRFLALTNVQTVSHLSKQRHATGRKALKIENVFSIFDQMVCNSLRYIDFRSFAPHFAEKLFPAFFAPYPCYDAVY